MENNIVIDNYPQRILRVIHSTYMASASAAAPEVHIALKSGVT